MTDHLQSAVICLLRPLIRLLLRSGIGFATFAEWVKRVYVAVAEEEFPGTNGKQSGSRIATLTGLHRKEVARIRSELANDARFEKKIPTANRAQRVTNAWLQDPRYCKKNGEPCDIAIKGDAPSFYSLVKIASGDIYPTAILDELLMADIIEYVDDSHIRMKKPGYIPTENNTEKLKILGQSGCDLLSTLEHNVNPNTSTPHLQMTVAYNHLSPQVLEEFKQVSREEVTALLLKLNTWLAKRDGTGFDQHQPSQEVRAGLGIYYFEDNSGSKNENK